MEHGGDRVGRVGGGHGGCRGEHRWEYGGGYGTQEERKVKGHGQ